jgi:hypothetical protein
MFRAERLLVFVALAVLALPARADDAPPPAPPAQEDSDAPAPDEEPKKKSLWIFSDEDEEAPPPPIVRAEAGVVLWPYLLTTVTIDRKQSFSGRPIDTEANGLQGRWLSPFIDGSIGTTIRGCVSWLDLDRQSEFHHAGETIDVGGGRILANPGDAVAIGIHYSQVDLFAEWDCLYGKRYRIGLLGGARTIRIATRIAGVQLDQQIDYQSIAVNDWLVSPIVGGQIELSPVSFFSVYTNIRVIDWAWRTIGLREERTFEMRVGFTVTFIEDILSASVDFRFLNIFASPNDLNGGRNLEAFELEAGGVALSLAFKY